MIGTFLLIGIVFIPIGIAIVVSSGKVVEVEQRYDDNPLPTGLCDQYKYGCSKDASGASTDCKLKEVDFPNKYLSTQGSWAAVDDCSIPVTITLDSDMPAPVYMYYKLSNFFQNHRRYVKSRSDVQLANSGSDTSTCDPSVGRREGALGQWREDLSREMLISFLILFAPLFLVFHLGSWQKDSNGKPFYPCGLIAGSFFVDRFSISVTRSGNVQFSSKWNGPTDDPLFQKDGIAWSSDKKDKFKPNLDIYGTSSANYNFTGILGARLPAVDDEDFIVWMRTAGLPTFKKLYRKINYDLKKGDVITVNTLNYFPVQQFSGHKAIVFSTTSWLGGKNSFLGWAYIVVGIVCIVLAIAFLIKHLVSPRPLGDMKFFQWPQQAVRQ